MAAPVINTTTSVLEGTQWQPFNFQPFATGTPTSWACPNLPEGITIHGTTGKISGLPEVAGVFVCGLTATNGDGTSVAVAITIGIAPGLASVTRPGAEVKVDLATGEVSLLSGGDKLFVKVGKDFILWVYLEKGGNPVDLDAAEMSFSLREFDPEANLTVSTAWKKFGEGNGAYFGIYGRISGDAVEGAVSNYEEDGETQFEGKAEIQIQENNPDDDLGPETLLFATRNFPLIVATAQQ